VSSRFKKFSGRGDYGKAKLGYFRVVRIKTEQAFFEIFDGGIILTRGLW